MQMICMRSRLQPNTGSQMIPKAVQQLESEQYSGYNACEYMGATHSSQHMSQQGDEERELPARLYKHPGTLNSAIKRHNYKRSETTWNRCVYAVQHNATAGNTMRVSIWELPTHLSTWYQSQQGDEKRELPARLYKHPGTLNSAIKRHNYKRSETRWNRCVYAVQHNATDISTSWLVISWEWSKAGASKQLKIRKEQNKLSCRQKEAQMHKLLQKKISLKMRTKKLVRRRRELCRSRGSNQLKRETS
ncbi:hypothetical protein F511_28931 [Dorcoceras hygrometricum]|uniref:Uncharacterized protein n=1 Tax=Dorcoceras hygrometricum TaxID=472368 RepID=A0A2Z7CDI7_9LAMI|nr:hypothetical protein F511_28931 [Dorcoceras hygrometricum]